MSAVYSCKIQTRLRSGSSPWQLACKNVVTRWTTPALYECRSRLSSQIDFSVFTLQSSVVSTPPNHGGLTSERTCRQWTLVDGTKRCYCHPDRLEPRMTIRWLGHHHRHDHFSAWGALSAHNLHTRNRGSPAVMYHTIWGKAIRVT